MAGTFNTTFMTELKLKIPEQNHMAKIIVKYHLKNNLLNYDIILGRYILHEIGIVFDLNSIMITWQEVSIKMKPPNCMAKESFVIKER